MACPDCSCPSGEFRFATSVETHGFDCGPFERFDEELVVCRGCGGRFDPRDWDETEEAPDSMLEDADLPDEGNNLSGSAPNLAASPFSAASTDSGAR